MFPAVSASATAKPAVPPATTSPLATLQSVHVVPASCETARLTSSPFVQGMKTVFVALMKCIGPGNSAFGAAIDVIGENVRPPSVERCTTTFRGTCWFHESSTVWSSVNVSHWRSAATPFDVMPPFASAPAVARLCPLFGDADVVKPLSAPRPAYAYW